MSNEFSAMLNELLDGNSLSESQAHAFMHELARGEMSEALAGAFLAGLRAHRPQLGAPHRAQTLLRYPGNQLVEPTVVVDISAVADRKVEVVRCYASQIAPPSTEHLVQGLDLLERTIVRQRAMGATIAAVAGEGFCHDGPLPVHDVSWLTR